MQSPLRDALTDQVFQELADHRRVVLPGALPTGQWQRYQDLAMSLDRQGLFRPAQIAGNDKGNLQEQTIRGDRILWLEEGMAPEIFEFLKNLQDSLNQSLYSGITHFECHFACYEPGMGYDTHVDQRKNASGSKSERIISFVLYLNDNWQSKEGGQLEIQLGPSSIVVEPQGGTLVMFDSRHVPHRVLASTSRARWSLTGWFRRWSNLNHAFQR